MPSVKIPPVLRKHTGDQMSVDVSGSNVGEVLNALVAEYPETSDQLFSGDGELNRSAIRPKLSVGTVAAR